MRSRSSTASLRRSIAIAGPALEGQVAALLATSQPDEARRLADLARGWFAGYAK